MSYRKHKKIKVNLISLLISCILLVTSLAFADSLESVEYWMYIDDQETKRAGDSTANFDDDKNDFMVHVFLECVKDTNNDYTRVMATLAVLGASADDHNEFHMQLFPDMPIRGEDIAFLQMAHRFDSK